MGLNSFIENFIGGFALGALSCFTPIRFGCCCGGGFGGFGGGYDRVDFGTFANGFPTIFPPDLSNISMPELNMTQFANPCPVIDFSNAVKTIYEYATDPNSPQNKMFAEMMKNAQNASSQSSPKKVQSIDYPFSPFYFPSQYTYYPFYPSFYSAAPASASQKDKPKSEEKSSDSVVSDGDKDKRFNKMLEFVLSQEGGYANNKNDKGGETNKGITTQTYNEYRTKKGLSKQSVKKITDAEVKEIYYEMYYKASGADKISDKQMALYVFDTAVNMGVSAAKDIYSKSGGDLNTFEQLRRERYNNIAKKDSSQKGFLSNWLGRVTDMANFARNELNYVA